MLARISELSLCEGLLSLFSLISNDRLGFDVSCSSLSHKCIIPLFGIIIKSITVTTSAPPSSSVISLVPPGNDPRPHTISLLRPPRPPPQDRHGSEKPNDKAHNHRNAIYHPLPGVRLRFYPLGQRDPDRGVIVPAFFPELCEGFVDVYC